MGYWGTGLFESDYALCTLCGLIDPFVDRIEENARNPQTSEWDEILVDELVISAKVIIGLTKQGVPLERLPRSQLLKDHRDKFAERWRENPETSEFQQERLRNILEVWDEMTAVSEQHEKENS